MEAKTRPKSELDFRTGMAFGWAFILLLSVSSMQSTEGLSVTGTVGINYGQIANNLPSPSEVVELLQSSNLTSVRIYDANPAILNALRNTSVEIVVSLGNEYVATMSARSDKARQWVKKNVAAYIPAGTNITGVLVGNEVYSGNDTVLKENLMGALKNIHSALVSLGLDKSVKVSTAHSFEVFGSSFPPSSCVFSDKTVAYMKQLLDFLSATHAPFLVNVYPYFAYKGDTTNVPLNYALFRPSDGVVDSKNNLHYDNLFYAQIDAAYAALAALGYGKVEVRVSETGWPSKGDDDEVGATPDNAKTYNGNLLERLRKKEGTPLQPNVSVQAFIFALFNENMKPGPTSERNYGLFKPDGTETYDLGLKGLKRIVSSLSPPPSVSTGNGSKSTPTTTITPPSTTTPTMATDASTNSTNSSSDSSSAKGMHSLVFVSFYLQVLALSSLVSVVILEH
jgi:exo-beta-1,3-glucanase (GH17 family)